MNSALGAAGHAEGLWAFLGALGWYPEINETAEWVSWRHDRYVHVYEDFSRGEPSLLRTGRSAQLVPPTVHRRAILTDGWPDMSQIEHSVAFLCLAAGYLKPLEPLRANLLNQCVIVGHIDDLRAIGEAKRVRFHPLKRWEDTGWLSARAVKA